MEWDVWFFDAVGIGLGMARGALTLDRATELNIQPMNSAIISEWT